MLHPDTWILSALALAVASCLAWVVARWKQRVAQQMTQLRAEVDAVQNQLIDVTTAGQKLKIQSDLTTRAVADLDNHESVLRLTRNFTSLEATIAGLATEQTRLAGIISTLQSDIGATAHISNHLANVDTMLDGLATEQTRLAGIVSGLQKEASVTAELGNQIANLEATTSSMLVEQSRLIRIVTDLQRCAATPDEVKRLSALVARLQNEVSGSARPASLAADLTLLRRDMHAALAHVHSQHPELLALPPAVGRQGGGKHSNEIELEIVRRLPTLFEHKSMVDVGAHKGDISSIFIEQNFIVTAVEANPAMSKKLRERFATAANFTLIEAAAGATDGTATLHIVQGADNGGDTDTQLSSVVEHPLYPGLSVSNHLSVPQVRLDTLSRQGRIGVPLGFLKTDTEGNDLAVLSGMGDISPEIISVEFWNRDFVFNNGQTHNDVGDYLRYFAGSPYRWHVELYRREDASVLTARVQTTGSLAQSWGNAYFFRDKGQFEAFISICRDRLGASGIEYA